MTDEGQRPRPEDFGLSPEAARPPVLFIEPHRGALCVTLLVAGLAVIVFAMAWTTGSPAAGMFLGPVFTLASLIVLLPVLMALVFLASSLEVRWRSAVDPHFRACRVFQKALETFEAAARPQEDGGRQAIWRIADLPHLRALASTHLGAGARVDDLDRVDTGADLLIHRDCGTLLVRCEAGSEPVDIAAARELAMARIDLGADEAVLVAPAGGTPKLVAYLEAHSIHIYDAASLISVDTDSR